MFEVSGDDGRTASTGRGKCAAYRQTGPGGLPLVLRLSEGLGRGARMRLEPHVLDALTVGRQVLPLLETIKVIDADLSYRTWFAHA